MDAAVTAAKYSRGVRPEFLADKLKRKSPKWSAADCFSIDDPRTIRTNAARRLDELRRRAVQAPACARVSWLIGHDFRNLDSTATCYCHKPARRWTGKECPEICSKRRIWEPSLRIFTSVALIA